METGDLVQETLYRVAAHLADFEPKTAGGLNAYFRQALNNRIAEEIRRSRRHPPGVELPDAIADSCPSPLEDLVTRMANRRICTANGHVYNLASNPPSQDLVCDIDGSELVQRPDDHEETVRARMNEQIPPLREVVEHYRRAGVLQTVDGREPISDVSARLLAALAVAPGQPVAVDGVS